MKGGVHMTNWLVILAIVGAFAAAFGMLDRLGRMADKGRRGRR